MEKIIEWFNGLGISNPFIIFTLLLLRKFAIGVFAISVCIAFVYLIVLLSGSSIGQGILLSIVVVIVGIVVDGA